MSKLITTIKRKVKKYIGKESEAAEIPQPSQPASEPIVPETWVPPGHFYSPIPDVDSIKVDSKRIFKRDLEHIPGIDLNDSVQKQFLEKVSEHYSEIPFKDEQIEGLRYYFQNEYYGYFDGTILYGMLRYLKPKRYIEIGSGFSSALSLDTDELFLDSSVEFTFIEPYPERLKSLLRGDEPNVTIYEKRLQDVDLAVFSSLEAGDILFIDSTHVTKTDSDVNHILFEILPKVASGVYIHFHDIFYPFEYPEGWVYQGRSWNEDYILRAFLQYNTDFEIVLFNSYASYYYWDYILEHLPLALTDRDQKPEFVGGGFWMRRK